MVFLPKIKFDQTIFDLSGETMLTAKSLAEIAFSAKHDPRNPGMDLDFGEALAARVNRSAVLARTASLTARRSIKKEWQAAWLLKAITCIHFTTLRGDDTPSQPPRLCADARQPLP